VTRLGSFRADTGQAFGQSGRLVFVFEDALVVMRPPADLDVANVLVGGPWNRRVAKLAAVDFDNLETAVSSLSDDASSEEVSQQFRRSKRTTLADVERVELHGHMRGQTSTAYTLTIRTTDGKRARLFVKPDEARWAADLLGRALGPRFQSDVKWLFASPPLEDFTE
jgi:hypothetical protein